MSYDASAVLAIPRPNLDEPADFEVILTTITDYLDGLVASRRAAGLIAARGAAGPDAQFHRATDTGELAVSYAAAWRIIAQLAGVSTLAARPGAGIYGRMHRASDAGNPIAFDNGVTWEDLAKAADLAGRLSTGGGTLTGFLQLINGAVGQELRYAVLYGVMDRLDGAGFTNAGASIAVNLNAEQVIQRTLNQNTTVSFPGTPATPNAHVSALLYLKQDATGGRTVTWPAAMKWPGDVAPALSGAGKLDVIGVTWDGTTIRGSIVAQNYAA